MRVFTSLVVFAIGKTVEARNTNRKEGAGESEVENAFDVTAKMLP
jgi:hypothetical protein